MQNKVKNLNTIIASIKKEKEADEKVKIYKELNGICKQPEVYEQRLNNFIIDYCSKAFNIEHISEGLWYCSDYNILKEIEIRKTIIKIADKTISYFESYKFNEEIDIYSDMDSLRDYKQHFIRVLNCIFKNLNLKIDIVRERFRNDLINLENDYKKQKYEIVSDSEVIEKMKATANQSRKDINEYCYKIICNNASYARLDDLKELSYMYSTIVFKTFNENIVSINNAIATSDYSLLTDIFISAFNKNVKLEKKEFIEHLLQIQLEEKQQ